MNSFKSKILIFAIIFAPITIGLGFWQIQRAEEKNIIIANYDELLSRPSINLEQSKTYKNWQPIKMSGSFKDLVIYEDNAILKGKAGFKIYHLFEVDDGSLIFVHRGFVPRNMIKNDLPSIIVPKDKRELEGTVLKKENNSFVKNIEESDNRIIQEFNSRYISDKFNLKKDIYLHNFLFNLGVRQEEKLDLIEKPVNMSASKHIGYAIQWFGLCTALIILTVYAYRRKDG